MVMQKSKTNQKKCINKNDKNNIKKGTGMKKTFKNIVSITKKHIKKFKPQCKKAAIELAMAVVKELGSDSDESVITPRVIPIPKVGGFLPLIPIFAGLSAAGGLAGGAAGIAKAVNAIKCAKERLKELKRHNKKMETLCIGKGLCLKERGDGLGIYVNNKKN